MSSRLIDVLPEFMRFVVVLAMFSYLPGTMFRRWLGLVPGADWALRLPLEVLLGLAIYAIFGWCCRLLGTSFGVYVIALQIAAFVSFGWFFITDRSRGGHAEATNERRRGSRVIVAVAAVIGILYYAMPPAFGHDSRDYANTAYVRTIISDDALTPPGVLAPELSSAPAVRADRSKGLFHPLVAAVSRLAGVDPAVAWSWLCVVLGPVALLAFYSFAARLLPGALYAFGAVALFVVFQSGFGPGFIATAADGAHLVVAVSWVFFAALLDHAQRMTGRALLALALLLLGGSLIHTGLIVHTGMMLLALVFFRVVFSIGISTLVKIAATWVLCGVIVGVWKVAASSPLDDGLALPIGMLFFFEIGDPFYVPSPVAIVDRFGLPFLIGVLLVPALLFVRAHRRYAWMSVALSVPAVVIALNPVLVPWLHEMDAGLPNTILSAVPVWMILALLTGSLVRWTRDGRVVRKLFGSVALFVFARLLLAGASDWPADCRAARAGSPDERSLEVIAFLNDRVPPGSVVLSDLATSEVISAYADVRIVALPDVRRGAVAPDAVSRQQAVASALSRHTSQREALRVIEDFGVGYVLLDSMAFNPRAQSLGEWDIGTFGTLKRKFGMLAQVFTAVLETDGIVAYQVVLGDSPVEYLWFPNLPFGGERAVPLDPCDADKPVGVPHVSAAAALPSDALAGEEIELVLSYRRDREPPSALPPVLHVRFEQVEFFEERSRFAGDKVVRMFAERRRGRVRHDVFLHPFDGAIPPDVWPIAGDVFDTRRVQLPRDLREGTYDISFKMTYGDWVSNMAVRDLLYNDDSYTKSPCAQVRVRYFVTR